jgi:predicted transcriptional regulator
MICEQCLDSAVSKLRKNDIAILQYLYNESINLPQKALHKHDIAKAVNLSNFVGWESLFRLECYEMVNLRTWGKTSNYYITDNGVKALHILSARMEE